MRGCAVGDPMMERVECFSPSSASASLLRLPARSQPAGKVLRVGLIHVNRSLFVDKILKGATSALGLTIPQSLIGRADEAIQ